MQMPDTATLHEEERAKAILARFQNLCARPHEDLERYKTESGRKIIACLPMQIPEEIVHAAGALPVVMPEGKEPVTVGAKHLQNFFCGYARSVVDTALKGRLDFFDGMVFQDTCHTMRPLFDIIQANRPSRYMGRLFLPVALAKPEARPFLVAELERFRQGLERFVGRTISDEDLRGSIAVFNENRRLLRRLYDLRREAPAVLRAREMVAITTASMLMPKEEHSALVEELLPLLAGRAANPQAAAPNRARVVLTGSLCEAPSHQLLDLIEDSGGVVADDDLYTGSRYFLTQVPDARNPLEALADAYLGMVPPCPTRIYPALQLGPYLVDLVKRADARGVIIIMLKFCEAHDYTYPHMRRHLDPAGIPYLMIKSEREAGSLEQVRTRVQAFMEIIRG